MIVKHWRSIKEEQILNLNTDDCVRLYVQTICNTSLSHAMKFKHSSVPIAQEINIWYTCVVPDSAL